MSLEWNNLVPQTETEPEEFDPEERYQSAPDGSVCERCSQFIWQTPGLAEYLAFKKIVYFDESTNKMAGIRVTYCKCGQVRSETEDALGRKPVDPDRWWKDI